MLQINRYLTWHYQNAINPYKGRDLARQYHACERTFIIPTHRVRKLSCKLLKICLFVLILISVSVDVSYGKEAVIDESWLEAQFDKTKVNKDFLDSIESSLLQGLRDDIPTTNKSILTVVYAWTAYEQQSTQTQSNTVEITFPNSKRIIKSLLPLLKENEELQKLLYEWNDYLLVKENDQNAIIANYRKAMALFYAPSDWMSLDEWHLQSTLDWANILHRDLKMQGEAESLYRQVIHYPPAKFTNPHAFIFYKRAYINAGKKLILLRKGDLKALKSMYFLHIGKSELKLALKEAIIETGGNPTEVSKNNFYPPGVENIIMEQPTFGSAAGAEKDKKQPLDQDEVFIAKQFTIDIPDYKRMKDNGIEKATGDVVTQRLNIISLVINQLQKNELSNVAKAEAITLLGEFRTESAVEILIDNIDFFDDRPYSESATRLPKIHGYVARKSLIAIGRCASDTILDILSTSPSDTSKSPLTFDKSKIEGYVEVLTQIEGDRYALLKLQNRLELTKVPIVKAQIQLAIDSIK